MIICLLLLEPNRPTKQFKLVDVTEYCVSSDMLRLTISYVNTANTVKNAFQAIEAEILGECSPHTMCHMQGSEKWIAQIAALLDKIPSVGQIRF